MASLLLTSQIGIKQKGKEGHLPRRGNYGGGKERLHKTSKRKRGNKKSDDNTAIRDTIYRFVYLENFKGVV